MSHSPASLAIYLLGPPRLERNGQLVEVDTRKAIALLAYLALHPERLVRDQLAAFLWPEYDQERAYANLRRTLWALNKAIADGWIAADNLSLALQQQGGLWIDVVEFQQLLAHCRGHGHRSDEVCGNCLAPLGQAVKLVRGDFLEGFSLRDSAAFDDWHFFEAESIRKELAASLEKLVQGHSRQQEDETAISYARRWLALDPLHEPPHRWLMQLYAWTGQPAAAARQYQECVRVLKAELDAPPEAETTALYNRIRTKQIGPRPAKPPPAPTAPLQPQPATSEALPTPPPVKKSLPAPAPALEDELRMVTVLCIGLVEPFATEQLYPTERTAQRVTQFVQLVETMLQRYEGRVERVLGEGVMALFGAQQLHEDDPERAVRTAVEVRQAAQAQGWTVSAAINSGHVYLNQRGATLAAIGPVVNLALRLQAKADPGQLLIGEVTYRHTQGLVICTPLAWESKGSATPLRVYEIERLHPHPQKVRGIAGLHAPLVGRSKELTMLQDALATIQSGEGQLVTLIGDAGVGKSRLVSELKQADKETRRQGDKENGSPISAVSAPAQERFPPLPLSLSRSAELGCPPGAKPCLWLEGRCLEMAMSASYWPFLDILRTYLAWQPEEVEADRAGRIMVALDRLVAGGSLTAEQREEMGPLLGNLLAVRFGNEWDDRLKFAGPEQIRHQTLLALRDFFVALAHQQPVVLVLEDLHWADSLSLDLITLLMEVLEQHPLLLLCVYRPERQHRAWQLATLAAAKCPDHFTEVRLRELTTRQSQQLVEALLTIENLAPKVKTTILQKAQGNPLFVEEVIRSLIDAGIVYRQDDVWQAKEEIENIVVPETVQSVILSRVDRLGEALKGVLQSAAVIGRVFSRRLLTQLVPPALDLDNAISALTNHALIYQERVVPEEEYSFKHVLVQEAIYQTTLSERREQFHRQVGEALEQLYADNRAERYEQLAYHYDRSGVVAKAIEYLLKAGEKAQAAFANDTALDYYVRLLLLVTEPVEQIDLHLQWGAVLERIGRWEEAETHYQEALARAKGDDTTHTARCQLAMGKLCQFRGDYLAALNWLEQAREEWAALNHRAGLAQALIEIGFVFWRKGEYTSARQYTEEGLPLVREVGDQPGEVRALNILAYVSLIQGDNMAARALGEESLVLARAMGDRPGIATALLNLGNVAAFQNDNVVARALYEESLALAHKMGDKRAIAVTLSNLGIVASRQGDNVAARALYEESLALSREMGDRWNIAFALCKLGDLVAGQNGNVMARALYKESLVLAREIGNKRVTAMSLGRLGFVFLMQGDNTAARSLYEESLALAREMGDRWNTVYSLVGLAGVAFRESSNVHAARLAAASEALRAVTQFPLEPMIRRMYDETVTSLRAALGEEAFALAWMEGQTMMLEETIELAMKKVTVPG